MTTGDVIKVSGGRLQAVGKSKNSHGGASGVLSKRYNITSVQPCKGLKVQ